MATLEIWLPAMTRVRTGLISPGSAAVSAETMQGVLSDAEAALAHALSREIVPDPDGMIDDLLDCASRLLIVASDLCSTQTGQDKAREHAAAALTSQLAALEADVVLATSTHSART